MTNCNNNLDSLFEKARDEEPIASFEETRARFLKTISSGPAGLGGHLLSTFNVLIISLSIFSALIVASLIFSDKPDKPQSEIPEAPMDPPEKEISLNINTKERRSDMLTAIDDDKEKRGLSPKPQKKQAAEASSVHPSNARKEDTTKLKPTETIPLPLLEDLIVLKPGKVTHSPTNTTKTPLPVGLQGTKVQFTINESTSTGKLASISRQAQKAGIDYTYVVDLKKKLIREFNVEMFIIGTDISSRIQVCVPKKGKFEITFGWAVNEEGKAIQLSDDITIAEAESKHPLH